MILRAVEGACILVLLAVFLAYLLAPALDAVRRRMTVGRRQRPLSRSGRIICCICNLASRARDHVRCETGNLECGNSTWRSSAHSPSAPV